MVTSVFALVVSSQSVFDACSFSIESSLVKMASLIKSVLSCDTKQNNRNKWNIICLQLDFMKLWNSKYVQS